MTGNSQFFVFGSLFDYCDAMCNDLKKMDNCQFINTDTMIRSKLLWFLYKVHNSGILNRWFRLPFRSVWYRCLFDKKRVTKNGQNHFVFFDSNPHMYDPYFLNWIRRKVPNARLSLIFVNTMKWRKMRDIGYFRTYFERIYTLDKHDAREYDFIHVEGIHSKLDVPDVGEPEYDVTFAGGDKGRGDILRSVYTLLTQAGMKCKFTVVGMKDPPEGISVQRIPYRKVLEDELASRAILEICVAEQNGNTLRALEAIMYNKLLVTNNKNVLACPYYDPRFMIVFEDEKELLDVNIYKRQNVDYQYKNDFSPARILDDIEKHFAQ